MRYRIKVCRKESKEGRLWLKHVLTYDDPGLERVRQELIQEAIELENILRFVRDAEVRASLL